MQKKRRYFRLCSRCGGALDPGERCDCELELDRLRATETPVTVTMAPRRENYRESIGKAV